MPEEKNNESNFFKYTWEFSIVSKGNNCEHTIYCNQYKYGQEFVTLFDVSNTSDEHKKYIPIMKKDASDNKIKLLGNKLIEEKKFFDYFPEINRKEFEFDTIYTNVLKQCVNDNITLFCISFITLECSNLYIPMIVNYVLEEAQLLSENMLPLSTALSLCENYAMNNLLNYNSKLNLEEDNTRIEQNDFNSIENETDNKIEMKNLVQDVIKELLQQISLK